MAAIFTALDMSAERDGAALFDRRHHLELAQAYMPGIGFPPVDSMAMKDVCDLQLRAGHDGPAKLSPGYRGFASISGASRSSGLVTARIMVLATRV